MTNRPVALARMAVLSLGFSFALAAAADVSVTPITWDVVGLSHNRPLTQGPELFPVAARVCNESGADIEDPVEVDFIWEDGQDPFFGDPLADDFINLREGSLEQIVIPGLDDGDCVDAYYEIRLTRSASAFGNSRPYRIEANTGSGTFATPPFRQIHIEELIRQNRNEIVGLRFGQEADESDWVNILGGGTINLAVGETYFFEKTTATATGYEQLQSFISLSNTLFRILDVETEYGQMSFGAENRIPVPHNQLYGDGCIWAPDTQSPNYLSCTDTGKVGGTVTTVYQIEILTLPGAGEDLTLSTLIYDLSGGSYHYNTDFDDPTELRNINVFDPAQEAGFAKRFIPSTIGADGVSTLGFTISNPNPVEVSGYNFVDDLPGDMVVASDPNASSTCGGSITANPGSGVVEFDGGTIVANGSCIVLVNVTVPFDAVGTYPILLDNEVDLFIGDAEDPADTAEATLEVIEEPPPPVVCGPARLAEWTSFDSAANPSPTFEATPGIASAQAGAGLDFSVGASNTEWRSLAQVTGQTLAQARSANAYYEFTVDTTGTDSADVSLTIFRQNVNAPESVTLDYGPAGSLVESITLSPIPTQSTAPAANNFNAIELDNLNPSGPTLFRLYAYGASGTAQPARMLNVLIDGEVCGPVDPEDAPDAPVLDKSFSPDPVRAGETSTLTFLLANPNATSPDGDLTEITFRDELPAGMQATGGFANNGCGGSWGLEAGDPSILLFDDGELTAGASCTLEVEVQSTTVGPNVNISDPIDALQTLPGNTAIATLQVLPPPLPPVIVKQFNPNPLLIADGETTGQTTLRFLITNVDSDLGIDNVSFVDELPADMAPVDDPLVFTDNGQCGTPAMVWNAVDNELAFSGGAIAAGDTCIVELEVEVINLDFSVGEMAFTNQTGPVSHVFNGIVYEGNDATATLVVDNPIPGVRIRKQVGPGSDLGGDPVDEWPWSDYRAVAADDDVYYLFIIENIGEVELTNVQISDPALPAFDSDTDCDWPGSIGELGLADVAGSHLAFCVMGPVTAGGSLLVNTAEVTANAAGDDVSDTDSATYAPINLSIVKSVDPATYHFEGQQLDYTFVVTSNGPAQLVDAFNIDDALPGLGPIACDEYADALNGNADNIFDPGESVVCIAEYAVQSGDLAPGGQIDNSATATVGSYESNEDEATANHEAVEISKSASPDPFVVGEPASYQITVFNLGSVATSTSIAVEDSLPNGISLSNFSGTDWNCVDNSGDLTCIFSGSLAPFGDANDESTLTLNVDVDSVAAGAGGGNNTATITSGDPGCEEAVPPARCSDTVEVDVESPSADVNVSVSKVSDPASGENVSAGDTIIYTVTAVVSNAALTDALELIDTLSAGLTLGVVTAGSFSCNGADPLICSLPAGTVPGTYELSYTTMVDTDASGTLSNAVVVGGDGGDPTPECDPCSTGHPVNEPSLSVAKLRTDTTEPIEVGTVLTYDITVLNDGNMVIIDVEVTDSLVAINQAGDCIWPGAVGELAPAESVVCSISYTVTADDMNDGEVVNTGTATAPDPRDPGNPPLEDEETVVTPTTPSPSLSVNKTRTDATDPVEVGSVLSFDITVANDGNMTLTDVLVSDSLVSVDQADDCLWPGAVGTLGLGQSVVCSVEYTVTQDDVDAGELINVGSATAPDPRDPNDPPLQDDDPVIVPTAAADPALELVKELTDAPDPIVAGSVLTYTITATNIGNVTLVEVEIEDDMISPDQIVCIDLLPGENCVLIGNYTVTEADAEAGELVNTAIANGIDAQGISVPEIDDSVTTVLGIGEEMVPVPVISLDRLAQLLLILLLLAMASAAKSFRRARD